MTVQRVTMLSIVRPWSKYAQCQHDSTVGYDDEHRTTLVDLHSVSVTVQRVTMLSIVRPWSTYTQCQHDSTVGYDDEHRTTLVDLHTVSA